MGTNYGADVPFTAGTTLPTVTTAAVTGITPTAATCGGNVTTDGGDTVTACGVCWNTDGNPTTADSHTTDGSGTGTFISSLTSLSPGVGYHVRAYATNSVGTSYGADVPFTTGTTLPSVTTGAVTGITPTSAICGGNVTTDGGDTVTAYGVCWNTAGNPTTADSHTTDGSGTGTFLSSLTSLSPGVGYHVRAYATNGVGTSFGADVPFVTATTTPTVTTAAVTNVTPTSATCGGNVTADGGDSVTAYGVCWNTAGNPTIADSYTTDGAGLGPFVSSLTGLSPGTTYHVRAYATNGVGTSYGADVPFTAGTTLPTVTTAAVTGIAPTSATCGGNVTADGGDTVTAHGVCWNTAGNPTIADSQTADGAGTGPFVSGLTGLSPGTTYHVRAYATNSGGTGYGADVPFVTTTTTPTVTTAAVTNIAPTSATCGGNVTADGGDAVTARGVCWNTAGNPTIADSQTADGGVRAHSSAASPASALALLTTSVPTPPTAWAPAMGPISRLPPVRRCRR